MKNLILLITLFIGVNCMAQDSLKTKQVTSAAPIKPKKEHKYLKQFGDSMANAGISIAGAAVIGTGGMVINNAQHNASKR